MPRSDRDRPNLLYVALVLAAGALIGLFVQDVVDGEDAARPPAEVESAPDR